MAALGKAFLVVVLAASSAGGTASACEPCPSALSLGQSLDKADLVIVGRRIDYDAGEVGPQNIRVKVLRVLKGAPRGDHIAARSWYGMCPYGIIVDDRTYLMVLKKSSEKPGMYEAVESGCVVKTLPVKSGMISVEGKSVRVGELKRKYKLKAVS